MSTKLIRKILQRALRLSRKKKCIIQMLADTLLLPISFYLALLLKQDSFSLLIDARIVDILILSVPLSLIIFLKIGFYRSLIRYIGLKILKTLSIGVLLSTLVISATATLQGVTLPISALMIYAMIALFLLGGLRLFLRSLYLHSMMRYKTRVIIYGAGSAGSQLATSLRKDPNFSPVAFIDDWRGMHGTFVEGLKVHAPEELSRLINNYGVKRILLAMPSAPRARRREIMKMLETLSTPVQTIPGMADVISGRARINEIRDIMIEDLLGRDPVPPDQALLDANIRNRVVLVTGAGGSIGTELCRQVLHQQPRELLLFEICEYSLYRLEQELQQLAKEADISVSIKTLLGSVQDRSRLESVMRTFGVQTIYHTAAYKHVPMVEHNSVQGIRNNVFGTLQTAQAAIATGVETFVLISTDKAVRPTNVMGATKRLAELICQALATEQHTTRFCMVRFGNVLGSSGSVVPLFRKQIAQGGPITVTHPDITRYFMTIPEAAQLVIQAGAMGRGGDVFVLDMGEPVRIYDLAAEMVSLSGLELVTPENPEGDIEIVYSQLRPGEKLYEELLLGEGVTKTTHPRIMTANEVAWGWSRLEAYLEQLHQATETMQHERIRELLCEAPTAYTPQSKIADLLWRDRQPEHHSSHATESVAETHEKSYAPLSADGNLRPVASPGK
ncbi:polysaccharide biosynthesis protein [Halomonas sp. ATCH28]|uniref:Polysaccharide biosynthesis protein n=1 Tax=Halomonas gemina TaxID=2945105 RepID=A0ABT0T696_9GAMM|nr:nucleoside-diphosphate sugar epimerase/dehydratase [Halomonas gemina]MCL7942307.1 polysaccharide biosynthesis protein [Halomonas gemina]